MASTIIMPQLGESVVEGTVSKWLVQEGAQVKEFDPLLEVSTDKVDSEIPSTATGTVLKIIVPEGETVKAGTVLAWIGKPGEEVPETPTAGGAHAAHPDPAQPPEEALQEASETPAVTQVGASAEAAEPATLETAKGSNGHGGAPAEAPSEAGALQPAGRDRDLGFISPVVARVAREHNVDLAQVTGTGAGGRITKKDVLAYVEQQGAGQPAIEAAPWETPGEGDLFRPTELMFGKTEAPAEEPSPTRPIRVAPQAGQQPPAQPAAAPGGLPGDRVVPLSNMRRSIAEHMAISKRTSPHVTTVMEANMQPVVAHRAANKVAFEQQGVNLTFTPYFIAAIVAALKAFPIVNSSWSEEGLVYHQPINVGMAVSLGEEGLIVPVIRNAAELSLLGLARTVNDLAERARRRRLQPDEVKGGTFTITNHGTSGSLFATPIINQPQTGILGVGAIQKRPVVVTSPDGADALAIRPMVYLSLTFDHRILDGTSADGFLAKVVETLEDWK